MSNYYWNEYVKMYGNDDDLNLVLKISEKINESLTTRTMNYQNEKAFLLGASQVKCSDVGIGFYEMNNSDPSLFMLYQVLKRAYLDLTVKTSMPLIILGEKRGNYEAGIYSVDFESNQIILISESVEFPDSKHGELMIAFFVNIDICIALDGVRGFIYGIAEVGNVIGRIKEKISTRIFESSIPRRKLVHNLGINMRKCSLIDILAI